MKLWDRVNKGDKIVADLLPAWQAILETLKAPEGAGGKLSVTVSSGCSLAVPPAAPCPTTTAPSATLTPCQSTMEKTLLPSMTPLPAKAQTSDIPVWAPVIQFTASDGGLEFEDDPFDPRPLDPEKEPNLYPPNPHNNWRWLCQEALGAGHLEIAQAIVTPVIYHGQ